jgi:hypothetical protein
MPVSTRTRRRLRSIDICRFREGQIVKHGGIPDQMAIAEQFGMPAPSRWLIRFLMGKRPR